jgi:hypothetical protein
VLIGRDRDRETVEKQLHGLGVHVRQHEREGIVRPRLDRREDVGEREALVGETGRALAALPPDMTRAALLSNARLVLEEQADTLSFVRRLNFI